jgi:zinc-ribbon domain
MFCPQCGTPNADGLRFCRSCGIELEAVASALKGRPTQPVEAGKKKSESIATQDWLEKHIEGVKNMITGAIMLAVSLLIGVAMALFVPGEIPWMLLWIVFFGWMACWGSIALAQGIGGVIESKSRLRLMGQAGGESAIDQTPRQVTTAGGSQTIADSSGAFISSPPLTVTESTTRHLDERRKE